MKTRIFWIVVGQLFFTLGAWAFLYDFEWIRESSSVLVSVFGVIFRAIALLIIGIGGVLVLVNVVQRPKLTRESTDDVNAKEGYRFLPQDSDETQEI